MFLPPDSPRCLPVLDDRHVGQNGAQAAVKVGIVVDNDDDLLWRRSLAPNRRYGGENVVPPIECVGADHHTHGEGAPGVVAVISTSLRCRRVSVVRICPLRESASACGWPRSGRSAWNGGGRTGATLCRRPGRAAGNP